MFDQQTLGLRIAGGPSCCCLVAGHFSSSSSWRRRAQCRPSSFVALFIFLRKKCCFAKKKGEMITRHFFFCESASAYFPTCYRITVSELGNHTDHSYDLFDRLSQDTQSRALSNEGCQLKCGAEQGAP